MKTISDVEKEFEEKFIDISEDKTLWSWKKDASVGQVRFFISQSLRQLLEQSNHELVNEIIALSDKIEAENETEFNEWRAFKRFRNELRDKYILNKADLSTNIKE